MKLYLGGHLPMLDGAVMAMGMFDGCHNGHKRVLRSARVMAARLNCPFVVWTYERHPLCLIRPEAAPLLLQDTAQRVQSIGREGADLLCLNTFDRAMADTPAEEFIRYLHTRFRLRGIALGRSHTFGEGAKGNPSLMRYLGRELDFTVSVVDTMTLCGEEVHSSAVRAHLAAGRLSMACAMLGRSYSLSGNVIEGRQLGRQLGFPTINVRLPKDRLLPRYGVYAAYARLSGQDYPGIANIGIKPTVGGGEAMLEMHLFGFEGDAYHQRADVRLVQFIRPERKFSSVEALKDQIARDIRAALL